jgi:hypothetical protein
MSIELLGAVLGKRILKSTMNGRTLNWTLVRSIEDGRWIELSYDLAHWRD